MLATLRTHLGLAVSFRPAAGLQAGEDGVPVRLSDGEIHGVLAFSARGAPGSARGAPGSARGAPGGSADRDEPLGERQVLAAFADLLARRIDQGIGREREQATALARIEHALSTGEPAIVYQPVYGMGDLRIDGAEALARFSGQPARSPDRWFAEAATVGCALALERQALGNAVKGFRPLWRDAKLHLGLNCSPQTVLAGDLPALWRGCPPDRIVLEITEHEHVEDYPQLVRALQPLRAQGVKLAIDDAGSGYASMRHILNIAPEIIKLDVSLTSGIAADRLKRAMAHALIEFGQQTGCRIVAEGVETAEELSTLREIGVHAAQGYHLGRPMPVEDFWRLCETERSGRLP